jgi:protein-disulfide isomerase
MFKIRSSFALFAAALSLAPLAACARQDETTQKKLDLVMSKLDALDKKIAQGALARPAGANPAAQMPQRKRPDPAVTYYLPVSEADSVKGPKTAKVTVVEAFEFACPYCAMLHDPMEQVRAKNPDVRFVGKQYVVHPDVATVPALAACAATRQGKWDAWEKALWSKAWPMNNGQPSFNREQLAPDALEKLAKEIGLDVARFKADRDGAECKAQLDATKNQLQAVGVSGTPSIFINGKPYQGPRTPEALTAAIDDARKQADATIGKGGVTADSYYDAIMKNAQKTL